MLHKLGRFLQFLGLFVIIPMAIAGQVMEKLTEGQLFMWAGIGALVFYLGTNLLQRN